MNTAETDTGITITLTAEEVKALASATAFYMEYCSKVGFHGQRRETADGLVSCSKKILPFIQQKIKEGQAHG